MFNTFFSLSIRHHRLVVQFLFSMKSLPELHLTASDHSFSLNVKVQLFALRKLKRSKHTSKMCLYLEKWQVCQCLVFNQPLLCLVRFVREEERLACVRRNYVPLQRDLPKQWCWHQMLMSVSGTHFMSFIYYFVCSLFLWNVPILNSDWKNRIQSHCSATITKLCLTLVLHSLHTFF